MLSDTTVSVSRPKPNKGKQKVLIISHGHPDMSPGGGEIAAYNLFNELQKSDSYEAVFFARHDQADRLHGGTTFCGNGKPNEILFHAPVVDWFKFSQPDKPKVWRDFREVLELTKPDIVHFHHYLHMGLELIREVKNYNPDVPVALTLHEFFGICHNHGQMIKATDESLCHKSSPSDCAKCFPQYSAQDFFLRKQFIQSYFELVDQFISPSEFLQNRYIEWGLPASKIRVIENIDLSPVRERTVVRNKDCVRFSFFGQINWLKGVDVLVDSFDYLPAKLKKKVIIEINGSGLEHQPQHLRDRIDRAVKKSGGRIRLRGKYQPSELQELMSTVDWAIVPSKWWENSPMVILEANKYGVPVICSNIGGMAEKVEDGVTGLHFQAGRADSLADQMVRVIENQDIRSNFCDALAHRAEPIAAYDAHLSVYKTLVQESVAVKKLQAA